MIDSSHRVLVLAASHRDAAATCVLLSEVGITCESARTLEDLLHEIKIGAGAGAVIVAKEALNIDGIKILCSILATHPKWSFLPFILLAANGDIAKGSSNVVDVLSPLPNLTLLERPVRASTLISVVRAALADRTRQYELRDLMAELEIAKSKAEMASEAKTSFLANMSHEIRTPLGIILGFSDFLADPETPDHQKAVYAQTIRRNGEILTALVDDVLDLAKVESGHMTIEISSVVTRDAISEVMSAMLPRASAKNVNLTLNVSPDVPWFIQTDILRFKQILINLISNAIKFTSAGNVGITMTAHAGKLRIVVSDSGIGISPEQAAHLFSAFTQADNSITRRFGGTGLGLVLSKRIAQALGGDLHLKASVLGQGSQFEVELETGVNDLLRPMTVDRHGDGRTNLRGKRVLLVDDSKDNQLLLSRILSKSNIDVETADDGQQAIERLESVEFDVVLMDVQMPRLGGYEAVSILRQKGYRRPIVALTAHAFKEDRDRAFAVGCNEYLTKPVDKKRLIDVLSQMVER